MPTLWSVPCEMAAFLYAFLKKNPHHDISICHTVRVDVARARNTLIKEFLKTDSDYLLFLDDDNVPDSTDFLDKMLEANKPVISWLVPSRRPDGGGRHRLCVFRQTTKESWGLAHEQYINIPEWPDVFPIDTCWMGCVLCKRDVIEIMAQSFEMPCEIKISYYVWSSEDNDWMREDMTDMTKIKVGALRFKRMLGEDLLFFERASFLWINLYAHKGVTCSHIGDAWNINIDEHITKMNEWKWLFIIN